MFMIRLLLTGWALSAAVVSPAEENPPARFDSVLIDPYLPRAYQNAIVDINGDGRLDIAALGEGQESLVAWYENPTWKRRPISGGQTTDHIDMAFHDIDQDGDLEAALASDFNLGNTSSGGRISWLKRRENLNESWTVYPIGQEPTSHRVRWVDWEGKGRVELINLPILGVGATPEKALAAAVRLLAYPIPQNPVEEKWSQRVMDQSLHIAHGLYAGDLDGDGRGDLLTASAEGITWLVKNSDGQWSTTRLARGAQRENGYSGCSEVTVGKLNDGRRFLATIEPWHGSEVAVYVESATAPLTFGPRTVIDDSYISGHAVATGDFDHDGDDEILAGFRGEGWTIYLYNFNRDGSPAWKRWVVDRGGVAVQGISVADVNGDGRLDFVATGGLTHNVMLYLGKE
ncbi:MAG TPA: VCBS repeat-containing protein [bacterium]|nr:VCBS repeat-containing protein [bacterium]